MRDIKRASRAAAVAPAVMLGRMGFTPNGLTVIGSALTGAVGLLAANGWFAAAAVCLWLFSLADTLDGALARATGRVTVFGAFLDSVCDRYAEAAVFLGIAWWYHTRGDGLGIVLAYLAVVGSLLVSYARARAEGVGLDAEVGWFQRPERVVVLGLGLLVEALVSGALLIALGVLALLTTVTVVQRVVHVHRLATRDGSGPS